MIEYGTRSNETIETRIAVESIKERVYMAVKELCIGGSDVRGRLVISVNILMALSPDEFPDEIKEDFNWVIQESTKYKSNIPEYQSDLEVTMKKIRNSTGEKIADRIFTIYSRIQSIRGFPLLGIRRPSE